MSKPDRRTFLQNAALGSVAISLGAQAARAAASDRLAVAIIGTGGMGMNHVGALAARTDVEIAAVCDVDSERAASAFRRCPIAASRLA